MGIEPTSSAWKADILADVLYPQLQNALYHNFAQMSSMNLGSATVKAVAFLIVGSSRLLLCLCKSQELRVSTLDLFLIAGLFNFAIHNPTCKINYPKSKDIIVSYKLCKGRLFP